MQRSLGLFTDTRPLSQPANSYRYALNAVTETNKGDINARSAETANELCYSLTAGHTLIGSINLDGNDKVIFSVHNSNGLSEISLITNQCTRTSLILSDCLDFSILSHVTGEYRLREGCKRTIYFRDDVNPPRIIDIDSLSNYKIDTSLGNVSSNWNCNLMKWFPDYTIPQIDLNRVEDSGGQIPVGVIQFTVTYMDEDLNPVGYITPTNPIPIINQSEGEEDRLKEGGYQAEIFGDTGYTNKSVILDLSNIDTQFKYIRLGALESYSGTGEVTRAILKPPVEITGSTMTLIYTGFNSTSDIITTEDEITQTRITYERFKDIAQISNRMIAAGTESKNIDFTVLQKDIANNVQIKWVSRYRNAKEGNNTSKTPEHYFYELSMPRDEVVPLAIVFTYTDGSESPAFHIPGRQKNITAGGIPINSSAEQLTDSFRGLSRHRRPPLPSLQAGMLADTGGINGDTGWDSANYDPTLNDQYKADMAHIDSSQLTTDGYVERWRVYNTAYADESNSAQPSTDLLNNTNNSDWVYRGQMGYHESLQRYPSTQDCNGDYIYPRELDENGDETGEMAYIRHHRMPDSAVAPHMGLKDPDKTVYMKEATSSHIGLYIQNVIIPTSLQSEIQGWKIVRAEFSDTDRTVIDRGIVFHNVIAASEDLTKKIQYQTSGYNRHRFARTRFPDGATPIGDNDACGEYIPRIHGFGYPEDSADDTFKADASNFDQVAYGQPTPGFANSLAFHGPRSKFQDKYLGGDYVKFDLDLVGFVRWFSSSGADDDDTSGQGNVTYPPPLYGTESFPDDNPGVGERLGRKVAGWSVYKNWQIPNRKPIYGTGLFKDYGTPYYNRKIENQHFTNPDTITPQGLLDVSLINNTQQETYTLECTNDTPINPFDMEWGKHFAPFSQNWVLPDDSYEESGRSFTGQSIAHYVSIKRTLTQQFSSLNSIRYLDIDNQLHSNTTTTTTTYGGDTHIGLFESRKTDMYFRCDADKETDGASSWYGYSFLVESTINTGLRHGGDLIQGYDGSNPVNNCEYGQVERYPAKYYYGDTGFIPWNDAQRYKYGNIFDRNLIGSYLLLDYCHHNFYRYNPDFSKPNNSKYYLALEQSFDWCSTCQYKSPLLLAYSESSFQEETTDRYRVFRPNNYKLLPGHTGIINDLFVKNNQLYAHTTQSLWFQPVNPQTIQTNENNLYIGTGEFFSIPATEPVSKPSGYWGCQHKWSVVPTEFGVFWCDAKGGDVFLFAGDSDPNISSGNNNFFKSNLKLQLADQLNRLNATITLSENNSANPNGIGYTATFDSKIDRYILTKKDYKLRDESLFVNFYILVALISSSQAITGSITISPVDNKWYVYDGIRLTQIYPTDFTYFDNLSWTFSYSPKDKSWTSFHSYLPTYMYSDRNTYYSTLGSTVWKHEGNRFLSFYETQYPFIIDYVAEISPETKKFHNIEYLSTVEEYDSTNLDYIDKEETFTSIIAYTDTQTTGELTITPKTSPYTSITHTNGQCTADRGGHNRTWKINYLRDLVTTHNQPIFTKDQTNTSFQSNFPIDKVPNTAIINQSQDQFNQAFLKDKYLGIRLKFLSTDSKKISFDIESSTFSKELR